MRMVAERDLPIALREGYQFGETRSSDFSIS